MDLQYSLVYNKDLTENDKNNFGKLLKEQGKVQGNCLKKAERCKFIIIVYDSGIPVAIGAIKPKTLSDFQLNKANVKNISTMFNWELGYIYTKTTHTGNKIASTIVSKLIEEYGNENLMASTEITENPSMVKILINHGFQQIGNTWKSSIHGNSLGLFIKYE